MTKPGILVVDDDSDIRAFIRTTLEEDYAVSEAETGEDALIALMKNSIDLVLLDQELPGMNGTSVLRKIRTDERSKDLPVVFLSGETSQNLAIACFRMGVTDFVPKPFDPDYLQIIVGRTLENLRLKKELLHEKIRRSATEKANEFKAKVLANVNHELRQPLSSILLSSETGKATSPDPETGARFDRIARSAQRLTRMCNTILDLSKFIENTGIEFKVRRLDFQPVFEGAWTMFEPLARSKKLRLRLCNVESTTIYCDENWISRILENLIANAVKFSEEEGEIHVVVSDDAGFRFSIANSGPPIPKDELEAIFEPFVRGRNTYAGIEGTGAGLSLCRKIIEMHGGHIWAENTADGMVKFSFRIPPNGEARHEPPVSDCLPTAYGKPSASEP